MSRRHVSIKKNNKIIMSIILVVVLVIAVLIGFKLYFSGAEKAMDTTATDLYVLTIPQGVSTGEISIILEEKGIIKSSSAFKNLAKLSGYDGKFKAGEYSLSPSMNAKEIMLILEGGRSNTRRFTIPEGLTVSQVADKLAAEGLIDRDTFMDEVENGVFNQKFVEFLPAGPNRLEGFLFPETYDIFTTSTEHDIINRMLNQFDLIYKDEYYARALELGYDINQIITIASMIERETLVQDEMTKVSSVIYNRLNIDMLLQIDATVQYALGQQKDRLTYKDLEVDSLYNTYLFKGLPYGPISSPGKDAIYAALYPDDTEYYYYVLSAAGNGTHNFAKTYNQFLNYKNQYLNSL